MDGACANGHLAVVKFLHENRREGCTRTAMRQAAARGQLEMVQWLYANRSEGQPSVAWRFAAAFGHAAVMEWLAGVVRGQGAGEDGVRDDAAGNSELSKIPEQKRKRPRLE